MSQPIPVADRVGALRQGGSVNGRDCESTQPQASLEERPREKNTNGPFAFNRSGLRHTSRCPSRSGTGKTVSAVGAPSGVSPSLFVRGEERGRPAPETGVVLNIAVSSVLGGRESRSFARAAGRTPERMWQVTELVCRSNTPLLQVERHLSEVSNRSGSVANFAPSPPTPPRCGPSRRARLTLGMPLKGPDPRPAARAKSPPSQVGDDVVRLDRPARVSCPGVAPVEGRLTYFTSSSAGLGEIGQPPPPPAIAEAL